MSPKAKQSQPEKAHPEHSLGGNDALRASFSASLGKFRLPLQRFHSSLITRTRHLPQTARNRFSRTMELGKQLLQFSQKTKESRSLILRRSSTQVRPQNWGRVDMVLPNSFASFSSELPQSTSSTFSMTAGQVIPAFSKPEFVNSTSIPIFQPAPSEPKPKWQPPAPGSRRFSRVEEVKATTSKEAQAAPLSSTTDSSLIQKKATASTEQSVTPLPIPEAKQKMIEEKKSSVKLEPPKVKERPVLSKREDNSLAFKQEKARASRVIPKQESKPGNLKSRTLPTAELLDRSKIAVTSAPPEIIQRGVEKTEPERITVEAVPTKLKRSPAPERPGKVNTSPKLPLRTATPAKKSTAKQRKAISLRPTIQRKPLPRSLQLGKTKPGAYSLPLAKKAQEFPQKSKALQPEGTLVEKTKPFVSDKGNDSIHLAEPIRPQSSKAPISPKQIVDKPQENLNLTLREKAKPVKERTAASPTVEQSQPEEKPAALKSLLNARQILNAKSVAKTMGKLSALYSAEQKPQPIEFNAQLMPRRAFKPKIQQAAKLSRISSPVSSTASAIAPLAIQHKEKPFALGRKPIAKLASDRKGVSVTDRTTDSVNETRIVQPVQQDRQKPSSTKKTLPSRRVATVEPLVSMRIQPLTLDAATSIIQKKSKEAPEPQTTTQGTPAASTFSQITGSLTSVPSRFLSRANAVKTSTGSKLRNLKTSVFGSVSAVAPSIFGSREPNPSSSIGEQAETAPLPLREGPELPRESVSELENSTPEVKKPETARLDMPLTSTNRKEETIGSADQVDSISASPEVIGEEQGNSNPVPQLPENEREPVERRINLQELAIQIYPEVRRMISAEFERAGRFSSY